MIKSLLYKVLPKKNDEDFAYYLRYLEYFFYQYLIANQKIDVVIDVGANTGQTIHDFLVVGFKGAIYSIEPNPTEFNKLKEKFSGNSQVTLFNRAVTSEPEIELNVFQDSTFSSVYEAGNSDHFKEQLKLKEKIMVKGITLDAIIGDILRIKPDARIFLKTDTQGYDIEVLKTGEAAIKKSVKYIKIELAQEKLYHSAFSMPQQIDYLSTLGFEMLFTTPLPYEDGNIVEMNGFFRNKKAMALV